MKNQPKDLFNWQSILIIHLWFLLIMIVFYLLLILNLKFIDYNNKSFNTNLDVYLKYREFNKTNYEIRPIFYLYIFKLFYLIFLIKDMLNLLLYKVIILK